MTEKQLKNLTRGDLLELLLEQTKRADELQSQVDELTIQLESREITNISGIGTLADASLQLNGVFEAADRAAKEYIENAEHYEAQKKADYDAVMNDARARAMEMLQKTYAHCDALVGMAQSGGYIRAGGASPEGDFAQISSEILSGSHAVSGSGSSLEAFQI